MNEILYGTIAFIEGFALGIAFFGGLWFTVKKTISSKTPALWVLGSFVFRVGITMTGFYFIAAGNWQRLIISLIGFIMARFTVMYMTKFINEK